MDLMQDQEARELFEAQARLYKLMYNYVSSMSVKCAVELGIPDIIHGHGRSMTLPELVSELGIQPNKTTSLCRLMRLLVHLGLFSSTKLQGQQAEDEEQEQEAYALTPLSTLLLKDKSYCLSPYVVGMLHSTLTNPLHFLSSWFRGNELTAFETAYGSNLWDYMMRNPEFNSSFNQGMASDSQMANLVVEDCKPIFEGLDSLVHVGGGTGSFSRIISEAFPGIKCTVLDLPHVVANLQETEHLEFIAGDMFQSIPPADACLLKMIFHAFGDQDCVKIMKKCREAIESKGGGKVIIIDIVINEKRDERELTEAKLFFDMLMMVHVTGSERTEKQWESLFLEAGFSHYKITPIFGLRSLIEVFP